MTTKSLSSGIKSNKVCKVEGCESAVACREWCESHYQRWRKHGSVFGGKIPRMGCSVEMCVNKHYGNGLCRTHNDRKKKTGSVFLKPALTNQERFWSKVNKTETCWNWSGTVVGGYGQIVIDRKKIGAHRYSYFLTHGYLPVNLVLHSCDNPLCVNPEHLREGTHLDNSQDKVSRNRQAKQKGMQHGNSKLTDDAVNQIRSLIKQGEKQKHIAKIFGVTEAAIVAVKQGRTWAHVIFVDNKG